MSWTIAPKGSETAVKKNHFVIGVGWDAKGFGGGPEFDLDVGVFFVDNRGKMQKPQDLVYYGNKHSQDGSVILSGDERTGAAQGDDEQLIVDLDRVPYGYEKLIVMVSIHEGPQRRQCFRQVNNCYVRLFVPRSFEMTGRRLEPQQPMLRFDLQNEYGDSTAVVFCELFRQGPSWTFRAVGKGFQGGFNEMMQILRP